MERVVYDAVGVSMEFCGTWDLLISFKGDETLGPNQGYTIIGDLLERS